MLNPLRACQRIESEYRRYLTSTFPLQNEDLRRAFKSRLEERKLSRGPFLQASPSFELGASVRRLVEDDVLSRRWLDLPPEAFPIDRPLYAHQEEAIRKARAGRNLVVTTGTGSGKTECFLIPIIDHLMREHEAGTLAAPGVRALFLYPMNALANDQIKRLRSLLQYLPSVTFGRYTGETRETEAQARSYLMGRFSDEPWPENELLSREAMKARPPSILLTNYAMLEYLLLRPEDSPLFDGATGGKWRFLALDEVHVYDGAQGAEIAMLLRRLRDRVNGSRRGVLQCFGTSATLGGGERDFPELVTFAVDLFDEEFAWDPDDPLRQDVVTARHRPLANVETAEYELAPTTYQSLREAVEAGGDSASLLAVARVTPSTTEHASAAGQLVDILAKDRRTQALLKELETGARSIEDAADAVMPDVDDAEDRIVDLVSVGVMARRSQDDAPVIPARYHFFLRALEGAFVCLHPEHDSREPRLDLARHEKCPTCAQQGVDAQMFELGSCRRCGAEYVVGTLKQRNDRGSDFVHGHAASANLTYALLDTPLDDGLDDEDETVAVWGADARAVKGQICPGCGCFVEGRVPLPCGCDVRTRPIRVAVASAARNARRAQSNSCCIACAHRSVGGAIHRFLTGADAPAAVLATDLYQALPSSASSPTQANVRQARKLLTFADSRQDAAFFAPYLEQTYRRAVQRRLIYGAVKSRDDDERCYEDLLLDIRQQAEANQILDPDETPYRQNAEIRTWLTRELVALDRRQSIEGTGLVELRLRFPRGYSSPLPLLRLGFTRQEADDLIRLLIDSVRRQGAIKAPEGVDLRGELFAPRNFEISIRERRSDRHILAWLPEPPRRNARLDLLERIFDRKQIDASATETLAQIWRMLTDRDSEWAGILEPTRTRAGLVYLLNPKRFSFVPVSERHRPSRCDTCRQVWWSAVASVCPTFGCRGTVRSIEDLDSLLDDHYARRYSTLEPIDLVVEEHTAQLVSSVASDTQDRFANGNVNVLSCSTTFELGVDVGDVQAVLLRNVPPGPANYIQRAGRAGRRATSAALVVCFAQRRSHDLYFFDRPTEMVNGQIAPPRVPLHNVPIVRRHVHAVAVAAYQRMVGSVRDVAAFFVEESEGPTHEERMITWLRTRPTAVGEALERIVPGQLHDELGLEGWQWVDALVENPADQPTFGWLTRASAEVREDVRQVERLRDEAHEERKYRDAGRLTRVLETVRGRPLINFLASRNVLPKYGFPVDVVEMSLVRTGDPAADKLELTRDLSIAIRDYAPGARVIAGKHVWASRGLVTRSGREWDRYAWVVCDECGAFRLRLQELGIEECAACGAALRDRGERFIIPVFGFHGASEGPATSQSQPRRVGQLETYFGEYEGDRPEAEPVQGIGNGEVAVSRRFSHQGMITVLNRGPAERGFLVCSWCGFSTPTVEARGARAHEHPVQTGRRCSGPLERTHLGHRFLTDVLEVMLHRPSPMSPGEAYSALYALAAATAVLGIHRDDVDGTLDWGGLGAPSFVLYDTVPGGAGHTQLLARRLPELIREALRLVSDCECGEETSCYKCIRSYRNQAFHGSLSRAAAKRILEPIVGDASPPETGVLIA